MENIEFIVLTCDKYLDTRVNAIKKTWGMKQKIKFLTDSESIEKEIIGFNTPQNYSGIYQKYLSFFKNYDFENSDYFFFTDDDTFVNLNNLNKLKLPNKEDKFVICRLLCLNPDGTDLWGNQTGANLSLIKGESTELPLYYPSGGSGFIISQSGCKAIQQYLIQNENVPQSIYSDVSVGFWMRKNSVNIIPNNNFWWSTHNDLLSNNWESYDSDVDVITFHYVNEEMMEKYHSIYNND